MTLRILLATLAIAAAPVSAQERVLSVEEVVSDVSRLDGQKVRVHGFLLRDISRRPRAELLSSTREFGAGSQILGLAQDVPIARKLARHLGHEVLVTGRVNAACFAPDVLCIHGRQDLIPVSFRIVEDR